MRPLLEQYNLDRLTDTDHVRPTPQEKYKADAPHDGSMPEHHLIIKIRKQQTTPVEYAAAVRPTMGSKTPRSTPIDREIAAYFLGRLNVSWRT